MGARGHNLPETQLPCKEGLGDWGILELFCVFLSIKKLSNALGGFLIFYRSYKNKAPCFNIVRHTETGI